MYTFEYFLTNNHLRIQGYSSFVTYVLMKTLESSPSRYDKGIKFLTLGKLEKIYDKAVELISPRDQVLDIGCGTGALSIRAAMKGANVKGIDINAGMLEILGNKIKELKLEDNLRLEEIGIAELGKEVENQYDFVLSGLCFSELNEDEIRFALNQIRRILKVNGQLIIMDETPPKNFLKRFIYTLLRFPLVILTLILTQTTTKTVKHLPEKILSTGFTINEVNYFNMDSFIQVFATKGDSHE